MLLNQNIGDALQFASIPTGGTAPLLAFLLSTRENY